MCAAKVVFQGRRARFKNNAHLSGSGWRVEKRKEATGEEEAGNGRPVGRRWGPAPGRTSSKRHLTLTRSRAHAARARARGLCGPPPESNNS